MTKSRIFKNLSLRRKANRNFRGKPFAGKPFQAPKTIFKSRKQADWPEVIVIWAPFERQNVEIHIFDKVSLPGFAAWEFTTKEDLNPRKEVFLLDLRLWFVPTP